MYEVTEVNDKLSFMYYENKESHVAINTPLGLTERCQIDNIEMQGSVLGPIKTAVQIDSLGKECMEKGENLYSYKKSVSVPPLSFIDDIAAFSKCGQKSLEMNAFLNTKIEMKKLEMNRDKCKKMHFGKTNFLEVLVFLKTLNILQLKTMICGSN